MPKVDSAIIEALGLDPQKTSISTHGGSDFTTTSKISCGDKIYFVKQGSGEEAEIMFKGEHTSLNAISSAVPTLCPRSLAHGPLSDSNGFFMATEFLDLSPSSSTSSSSSPKQSLAQKLSQLHKTPSPTNTHGFPVPTCCGSTIQDNTPSPSWSTFFNTRRLLPILQSCEKLQGKDPALRHLIETTTSPTGAATILLSHLSNPTPVLTHGDLWSGNTSTGIIHNRTSTPEAVIFDPSCTYAPAEYDHGIMVMYPGGVFTSSFWKEYWSYMGDKEEPVEEYDDRVQLYEAYHQLNHYSFFGGGYKDAAVRILKRLEEKYGRGGK